MQCYIKYCAKNVNFIALLEKESGAYKQKMSQKHVVVCEVFLWCLAAIYLFSFTSLYVQVPG